MKIIQFIIFLSVILLSSCITRNNEVISDNPIVLREGESRLLIQHKSTGIAGGYFEGFYVLDRSVADLEYKDGSIYIIGKSRGETIGAKTNLAYLDSEFFIRDNESENYVEKSLKNNPVKIIVN